MNSIDWNDVNVLRKLPDGWYSVPSDSKYGEMINKNPRHKVTRRHERILEKEREIDDFIKSERLRDKTCTHRNYSHKEYLICAECGLTKRDFDMRK